MKQFIGCDVHKRYSVFVSMDEAGKASRAVRVTHGDGELETYLSGLTAGTPVAVGTTAYNLSPPLKTGFSAGPSA